MIGIYLSGTGNTKHCVEKLVNLLDAAAECIPLEAPHVTETLEKSKAQSSWVIPRNSPMPPLWCVTLSEKTAACGMAKACSV